MRLWPVTRTRLPQLRSCACPTPTRLDPLVRISSATTNRTHGGWWRGGLMLHLLRRHPRPLQTTMRPVLNPEGVKAISPGRSQRGAWRPPGVLTTPCGARATLRDAKGASSFLSSPQITSLNWAQWGASVRENAGIWHCWPDVGNAGCRHSPSSHPHRKYQCRDEKYR